MTDADLIAKKLVHGYQDVDNAILRDVAEHRLEDLLSFVEVIRGRLSDI